MVEGASDKDVVVGEWLVADDVAAVTHYDLDDGGGEDIELCTVEAVACLDSFGGCAVTTGTAGCAGYVVEYIPGHAVAKLGLW